MGKRYLLAACLIGSAALLRGAARAEDEFKFGMAIVKTFGWDDLAEKHFQKLVDSTDRQKRLAGTLGMGGLAKARAEAAERAGNAAEAKKLYDKARDLLQKFKSDARDSHPDYGEAMVMLGAIQKRYVKVLTDAMKEETDEGKKAELRRQAVDIYKGLVGPLKDVWKKNRKELGDAVEGGKKITNELLEKAVFSMQRYVNMALDMANLYEGKSEARKTFIEALVKELEAETEFYDGIETPLVVLWIRLSMGRAYTLQGKLKEADENGFNELLGYNTTILPPGAKAWVDKLKLAGFYIKSKALYDTKEYDKAIKAVSDMFAPPMGYPWALEDWRGCAALVLKAKSYMLKDPPDYQAALNEANKGLTQAKGDWRNNFRQLIAEIRGQMDEEADEDDEITGTPQMLYEGAIGAYQLAKGERDRKKRDELFEKAVRGFEDTVLRCRAPDEKYRTRLELEPASWFALGLCYSELRLWYEARFAFEAVLRYFAKDVVGRGLARQEEHEKALAEIEADIKARKIVPKEGETLNKHALLFDRAAESPALKGLLGGLGDRLEKSANNLMVAARRRRQESPWEFDMQRLSEAMETLIRVSPEKRERAEYFIAELRRQEADGLADRGKLAEAIDKWAEAADMFFRAAEKLPDVREAAFHYAGKSYYRAMSEAKKLASKDKSMAEKASALGGKALHAFARFEREAKANMDETQRDPKRVKRQEEVYVARPVIHMGLDDHAGAIKAADRYLALAEEDPHLSKSKNKNAYVPTVLWTRLKAIREQAMAAIGTPDEGERLKVLVQAADELKVSAPKYHDASLSILAGTFNEAANKLTEVAKEATGARKARLEERAGRYRAKFAEYMKAVIERQEGTDLATLLGIVAVFVEQKAYDGARDLLVNNVLKEHDASGSGQRVDVAPGTFKEAAAKVVFPDEAKTREVREQITSLKPLVFGEPESERKKDTFSRKLPPPAERNWAEAVKIIDKLLKDNPTMQSKAELEGVKKELVFRVQMLSAKLNLADCEVALAEKRKAEGKDEEAKALWEGALGRLGEPRHEKKSGEERDFGGKVREYYWRDNALRFMQAGILEKLGRFDRAMELYSRAIMGSPQGSENWYAAQKARSRIAFMMGEEEKDKKLAEAHFRTAMQFPGSITLTGDEAEWGKYWPDAREYVAKCEDALRKVLGRESDQDILAEGRKTGTIKDDPRTQFEVSPEDERLWQQLRVIEARIEDGVEDKDKRKDLYREQFEVHISELPDRALNAIRGELYGKNITKAEARRLQKLSLARLIYQSPFRDTRHRDRAVRLGIIESERDGIPLRLVSDEAKKVAKKLGLLTEDGKKKPISEVDESLLRKELEPGSAPAPEEETPGGGADVPAPDGGAPAGEVTP